MRRTVFALVLAGMTLISGLAGPATAQDVRADLAALAVSPTDISSADYFAVDGRACFTPAACADPTFIAGTTEATLTEIGIEQAYALPLVQFSADGSRIDRVLATTIAEFDDAGGAREALPSFLAWLADPAAKVEIDDAIGQDAELFVIDQAVVGDENSTGGVGLRFRRGAIVVGIEIREYAGAGLDNAFLERLGRRVVRRIDDATDTPGLGALVIHHRSTTSDLYAHRSGTTIPIRGENATRFAERAAEFAAAEIQDVYLSRQILVEGDDPENPELVLAIALYRLQDAAAARAYVDEASTTFTVGWERSGLPYSEPVDGPLIGAESIWYLNVFETGYQVVAFVRESNIVARVIWQWNDSDQSSPSTDLLDTAEEELLPGAIYTADQQIICIENGACPGVTRLSSRLLP